MNKPAAQQLPIYILNLPEGVKRRAFMQKQLQEHKLKAEFFKATKGEDLSPEFISKFKLKKFMYKSKGDLGCTFSHYFLLKKIIQEKIPMAMVFEDDAIIDERVTEVIRNVGKIPIGWDVLMLGYTQIKYLGATFGIYPLSIWHNKKINFTGFQVRYGCLIDSVWGAHAFLITYEGARKVAKFMERAEIIPYDVFLQTKDGPFKLYGLAPSLSQQLYAYGDVIESHSAQYRPISSPKSFTNKIKAILYNSLGNKESPFHRLFHTARYLRLSIIKLIRIFRIPVIRKD